MRIDFADPAVADAHQGSARHRRARLAIFSRPGLSLLPQARSGHQA